MTALGRRLARLLAVLLLIAMAGCSPGNTGTVTGGIIPCSALGIAGEPHYAAGIVTVLEGQLHVRSTGRGTSMIVLPMTVVVAEQVGVDATFDFILKPGDYVLRARFPVPRTIAPWVSVTVHAGQTGRIDIPNMCI
jgi:hypothetical protein